MNHTSQLEAFIYFSNSGSVSGSGSGSGFRFRIQISWFSIRPLHTNVLSQFSFPRFSVRLERRCSPPRHAFSSSRLVFPRGIRNLLAITYSDNFRKTCHFQVAWTPAILFSALLVFPLTSTIEGRCSRPNTKMFSLIQSQQELRSYFSEEKSVSFPERYSV